MAKGKKSSASNEGKAKKQGVVKPEGSTNVSDLMKGIIDENLWNNAEYVDKLAADYVTSEPYQHSVINPLCDRDFLVSVHHEITQNMKANFKETDLFKVFQTNELGTLDEETLGSTMPNLLKLRKVLYSKNFRDFISKVTNCRPELNEILTDRVDCSINAYANSCHLLCHDDVIGTRCVSYIIYLPNPDEPWVAEDGGAVELYPLDKESVVFNAIQAEKESKVDNFGQEQGIPTTNPSKSHLPVFNSMLFFKVLPGKSYHSVQEVFNKNSPRLSISGWYHTEQPPVGSDYSSLKLIMKYGDEQKPLDPIAPETFPSTTTSTVIDKSDSTPSDVSSTKLSKEDKEFLSKWISPVYLENKNILKLQKRFIKNSAIQLKEFLKKFKFLEIQRLIILIDQEDQLGKGKPSLSYDIGLSNTNSWKLIGPCHKRRYLAFTPSAATTSSEGVETKTTSNNKNKHQEIGQILNEILSELFKSSAFHRFLHFVTTLIFQGVRGEIRRFRPGLDYTVAHYGIITKEPWLDMNLCFVNDDNELEANILKAEANKTEKKGKKEKSTKKVVSLKANKKRKLNDKTATAEDEEDDEDNQQNADDEAEEDNEDYGELWEDGDVGGFECFIEADDDAESAEAAEVYRSAKKADGEDEDNTTLLSLSAASNSLSLVLRDEGIMKFIKYVSANAPGSRWDISTEFAIVPSNDDDEDDDEEEDEDDDEEEDIDEDN